MKRLALVPLLAAGGCLYLGSLNEAPTVTLDPPSASITYKGSAITVRARVQDDQDDVPTLQSRLTFVVASADDPTQRLDPCDLLISQLGDQLTVSFFRTGVFSITATTVDRFGARSNSAGLMVTITDAPPAFANGAKPAPTSPVDSCGLYAAGDPLTIGLMGGAVTDPDAAAQNPDRRDCATRETLRYTWRVVAMPDGSRPLLTRWDDGCAAPTAASGPALEVPDATAQVCLWPDVGAANGAALYGVALEVSDGTQTVASSTVDVPVGADAPPCITGTLPPAGTYVFDRNQTLGFDVTGVADDRDSLDTVDFVWSVWRESDPVWRVVPAYDQRSYTFDPSSVGVGEQVRLRVEVRDRTGAPAGCDPAADDCVVTSCAAGTGACHQWKTWDFELR